MGEVHIIFTVGVEVVVQVVWLRVVQFYLAVLILLQLEGVVVISLTVIILHFHLIHPQVVVVGGVEVVLLAQE